MLGGVTSCSVFLEHEAVFVVPAEAMATEGVATGFAAELKRKRGVSADWLSSFNRAFSDYSQRAKALNAHSANYWRPARTQNLVVAVDSTRVRPYFQPFHGSSWFVYASDFEAGSSSHELSVFLLFYVEHLGLVRDAMRAGARTLSYLLTLNDEQIADLCAGCLRTTRPDAVAFRTLAEHMPALRQLHHDDFSPAPEVSRDDCARIREAGLLVPKHLAPTVQGVANVFGRAAEVASQRYLTPFTDAAGPEHAEGFVQWLKQAQPQVLLNDEASGPLWDPNAPDSCERLRDAIQGMTQAAARSLQLDLQLVSDCSGTFLSCLKHPELLPKPTEIEQEGGTYLHNSRKLLVYDLEQPGLLTLVEPAPPFHRQLLAARSIHEWGHLAVDAGWVRIPVDSERQHADALRALEELFDQILSQAPLSLQQQTCEEASSFSGKQVDRVGPAYARLICDRASDFASNLLARHFLGDELRCYLRGNVRSLRPDGLSLFNQLARHAYEFQYLRLADFDDPTSYFFATTWAHETFIDSRLVTEQNLTRLFDAAYEVLRCYEVDHEAFHGLPRTPPPL